MVDHEVHRAEKIRYLPVLAIELAQPARQGTENLEAYAKSIIIPELVLDNLRPDTALGQLARAALKVNNTHPIPEMMSITRDSSGNISVGQNKTADPLLLEPLRRPSFDPLLPGSLLFPRCGGRGRPAGR